MAVRQITTEISIKNEAEFRKQMKAVNNSLSGMKSEMAKVSAEFDGQANSADALRKKQAILQQQYDQQKEKVQALARMLESAKSAYDENSDVVLSYQRQLNTATVELIKFDRELKNTDKYLDEAAQSADGTASSIDEFGKAVKDAGDEGSDGMGQLKEAFSQLGDAAKSGDINGVVAALGSMKGVLVGGAAVARAHMEAVKRRLKEEKNAKDEDVLVSLQLVNEMLSRGYEFLPIELGKSLGSKYVVEDDKVRLPFSALKGLGGAAADALERVTIHGEEYISVEELQQASGVGSSILDRLRQVGALGDLPESSQVSFF